MEENWPILFENAISDDIVTRNSALLKISEEAEEHQFLQVTSSLLVNQNNPKLREIVYSSMRKCFHISNPEVLPNLKETWKKEEFQELRNHIKELVINGIMDPILQIRNISAQLFFSQTILSDSLSDQHAALMASSAIINKSVFPSTFPINLWIPPEIYSYIIPELFEKSIHILSQKN